MNYNLDDKILYFNVQRYNNIVLGYKTEDH